MIGLLLFILSCAAASALFELLHRQRRGGRVWAPLSFALSMTLTVLSFRVVSASGAGIKMIAEYYYAPALLAYTLYAAGISCARLFLARGANEKSARLRLLYTGVIVLCGCMACEFFLFNSRRWVPVLAGAQPRYYYSNALSDIRGAQADGAGSLMVGEDGASVTVPDIGERVYSVGIGVSNSPEEQFDFRVKLYDGAYSHQPRESYNFLAHAQVRRSRNVGIYSRGDMRMLTVDFQPSAGGLGISFISINVPPPFSFEPLRFLGLFCVVMGAVLIKRLELWRVRYDPKSSSHKLLTAALALCMAGLAAFTFSTSLRSEDIESGTAIDVAYITGSTYGDVFHQMFDSYRSGQLYLKIDADPRLAALPNPYDPGARDDIPYEWDRAYYNGKYYSYFGAAPLLTLYAPYYFIIGRLPSSATVCFITALLFILGSTLLFRRLLLYFRLRPPLLLYLGGLAALLLGSNVFWCMRQGEFYEVAAIYGITAAVWWFYFMLRARISGKALDFLACGALVVLTAASRPNMLVYCLLGAPLIIGFALDKKRAPALRIMGLGSFCFVVSAGAAGIMAYNYARFGSVFEFGAALQLTVSDIRVNTPLDIYNIIPALYHYLLQPPRLSLDFPYFERTGYPPALMHNYYFRWSTTGAFFYPVTLLASLIPAHRRHEIPEKAALRLLLLIAPLLCMYLTFSMGGAHYRYTADFFFFLVLAGTVSLFLISRGLVSEYGRPAFNALFGVIIITALLALLMSFSGENAAFLNKSPAEFIRLKYILEWFR